MSVVEYKSVFWDDTPLDAHKHSCKICEPEKVCPIGRKLLDQLLVRVVETANEVHRRTIRDA